MPNLTRHTQCVRMTNEYGHRQPFSLALGRVEEWIANQRLLLSPGETERFGQHPVRDGVQCSRNKYDPFHNILAVVTAHGWAVISTVTLEARQRPRKRGKQVVSFAATAKQEQAPLHSESASV